MKNLQDIKQYCKDYIEKTYGHQYVEKTRISKNGLFIYGGKYNHQGKDYPVYTYLCMYDVDKEWYIKDALDCFVAECQTLLKESD